MKITKGLNKIVSKDGSLVFDLENNIFYIKDSGGNKIFEFGNLAEGQGVNFNGSVTVGGNSIQGVSQIDIQQMQDDISQIQQDITDTKEFINYE